MKAASPTARSVHPLSQREPGVAAGSLGSGPMKRLLLLLAFIGVATLAVRQLKTS